jgi:hypothetical protein
MHRVDPEAASEGNDVVAEGLGVKLTIGTDHHRLARHPHLDGCPRVERSTLDDPNETRSGPHPQRLPPRVSMRANRTDTDSADSSRIVGLVGVSLSLQPGGLHPGQACDGLSVVLVAILWSGTSLEIAYARLQQLGYEATWQIG